jgi:hypothetical protein
MDWKGLLNWTLKYQDGTVDKNLKPMSEEDMKFIEAAFESVQVNEMKEIWKILDKLKVPETESETDLEEDIQNRCDMIEDLQILIDGAENARNIVRGKRFPEIVNYFFSTKHKNVKLSLASLLGSMMQNDKFIQTAAIDLGIFKILDLINSCNDKELSAKYIYILTGILYGEFEKSKTLFLEEFDGLKLLYNLLIKNCPQGDNPQYTTFKRVLNIIKELTKIEEKEAENFNVRRLCLNKMGEINLHKMMLEILSGMDYNTSDNADVVKIVLEILIHCAVLFESLDSVFSIIQELNSKLNESKFLSKEEIAEEKNYIIHVLKSIKSEFNNKNIQMNNQGNVLQLIPGEGLVATEENSVVIVKDEEHPKGSMHIQLKK